MKVLLLFTAICLISNGWVCAQSDSISTTDPYSPTYTVELSSLAASGNRTPFWLGANQYGVIPRTNPAGLLLLATAGRLGSRTTHTNRYLTYGIEAVGIAGRQSTVILPQAYASLDRGYFSLWAGRKKEIIGLGDSTLSSGFYSWSGNALPITKVQLGTNRFVPLGFTNNVIAVHAFYAHGWFANTDSIQQSYLHQKALYVRIGKPGWKVKLTGGVLHNAQWGGHSIHLPANVANDGQLPESVKDYLYVVTAKQPDQRDSANHTEFDAVNRFGNHLGSIDFGLELSLGRWQAMGYHQHPFEDKSGAAFVNFPDGLYGVRLQRQYGAASGFRLQHIVVEYLSTMSQGGSLTHTGSRYDGKDDYFNNYQYLDGWTQKERVIGTPFLSRRSDLRPERQNEPGRQNWSIANNQVKVWYLGLAGTIGENVRWQTRLSISQNYGAPRHPFVQSVSQFSGAASLTCPLNWLGGSELQLALASDQGQLYTNSAGGRLTIRKTWKTTK